MSTALQETAKRVAERLDKIEGRLDVLETRLGNIDASTSRIAETVAAALAEREDETG